MSSRKITNMSTSILNGSIETDQQNNSYIRPGSSCSDSTCIVTSNDGSRLHIDVSRGGFCVYGTDRHGNRLYINTNYINQGEVQFKSYGGYPEDNGNASGISNESHNKE